MADVRTADKPLLWLHGEIADAIVILAVFAKTTPRTPKSVIKTCKARLRLYAAT